MFVKGGYVLVLFLSHHLKLLDHQFLTLNGTPNHPRFTFYSYINIKQTITCNTLMLFFIFSCFYWEHGSVQSKHFWNVGHFYQKVLHSHWTFYMNIKQIQKWSWMASDWLLVYTDIWLELYGHNRVSYNGRHH